MTAPHGTAGNFKSWLREEIDKRNRLSETLFSEYAWRLSELCREMAERFQDGGKLLAFGRGAYATDAEHVSVEFVHPVIVGKKALPALDISFYGDHAVKVLGKPQDMLMTFASNQGDPVAQTLINDAKEKGLLTFSLQGKGADLSLTLPDVDPFIAQEMIETMYHTLWETVHVFFEHHPIKSHEAIGAGAASFLYSFLGSEEDHTTRESAGPDEIPVKKSDRKMHDTLLEVAASIRMKAQDDAELRVKVAETMADEIAAAISLLQEARAQSGRALIFGNGGSATDANDFAYDLVHPLMSLQPYPAISLSRESAVLSALANDIGPDVLFMRQIIAQATSQDVAIGISTSGGSKNVLMAFEEARKRGMRTIALLGYDGGEVVRRRLADIAIVVPSDYIPRIQEVQATIYHIIRQGVG